MTVDEALQALGLAPTASWPSWPEVRHAYRARIRATHPDVAPGQGPEATAAAARLNVAFAVLEEAYRRDREVAAEPIIASGGDRRRAHSPADSPAHSQASSQGMTAAEGHEGDVVLVAGEGDVLAQLAAALDTVGVLTHTDLESGYLQAVIDSGRAQLMVSVEPGAGTTHVLFTLEPLGSEPAPPLEDIVRAVAHRLRVS